MSRFSLTSLIGKLQLLLQRFPVTLLLIVGVAGLAFWETNSHDVKNISYCWWVFFIVGTIISLVTVLGTENIVNCLWQYGITVVSVLLWGLYCLFLPSEKNLHFDDYLQTSVIATVFSLAVFFISFLKKSQEIAFLAFSKELIIQGCIAGLFGFVLFAGLSLAAYSLDTLFGVRIESEVYENLAIICFILFSPAYFLANIPDKTAKYSEDISFYKTIKILGLYILYPILSVYTLILYVYLARIIIVWELPNGWVSTLVSALASGGLLVLLFLYPVYLKRENKAAVFLSHYFGLLLLPLLALMSVGIFRRISDYGLTINRCYILVLNIWFYAIFIYLFVTRSKHIKWIPISAAVIALLVSIGPWRISRVTQITLQNRIETHISQLDFLKDGKISLSASSAFFQNMDKKEKEKIREPLKYLADKYGMEVIQPFFEEDITKKSSYEIIRELNLLSPKGNSSWFSVNITDVYFQNTVDYKFFVFVEFIQGNKNIDVSFKDNYLHYKNKMDNRSFSIPLKESIQQLIKEDHNDYMSLPFSPENKAYTIQGEQYSFLITNIEGNLYPEKKDSIQINSIRGYLFYK
jgi:hypothetical protein